MVRLTMAIPRPLATSVRYPFSRLTVLHGFFQDLNFHRLLAQKALKSRTCFRGVSSEAGDFLSLPQRR
jgi:hypothetical protein